MNIDWDAVRELLPIYAYEYEIADPERPDHPHVSYWYPWEKHNLGQQPPEGWTAIVRDEDHPEHWRKAVNEWEKSQRVVGANATTTSLQNEGDPSRGGYVETSRLNDGGYHMRIYLGGEFAAGCITKESLAALRDDLNRMLAEAPKSDDE